jgi:hypothetical protein
MSEPFRTTPERLDDARDGVEFAAALGGFFDALSVLRDAEEAAEVDQ